MYKKNNIEKIEQVLKKEKCVALVAPSFIVNFSYPHFIKQLKDLGFDKVTELTFGAKMLNRNYHRDLKKNALKGEKAKMLISSTCPGVVNTIKTKFPELSKNLIQVDSPLSAMGKICKKYFPKHKLIFISPCTFKKKESEECPFIDYVIDYVQLEELFKKYKIKKRRFFWNKKLYFDSFYNDYTKIYPLSGALAKTAHLKGVVDEKKVKVIDGITEIIKFLENPSSEVQFLDCLFCEGGCIGGPHTTKKYSLKKKKKLVLKYLKRSKKLSIPENRKGLIKKAKGINFDRKV